MSNQPIKTALNAQVGRKKVQPRAIGPEDFITIPVTILGFQ